MLAKRLEQWLGSVGIAIETDRVRIRATEGGLGVFAVKAIHGGDPLCTIPKSAVLSVKTSGIAGVLEENKIRGGLGLIIAILYELSLHATSPWYELPTVNLPPRCISRSTILCGGCMWHRCLCHCCRWGYLSELPAREYLPMFWTPDELELLQGTVVAVSALVRCTRL